jgi:hypothetical protein
LLGVSETWKAETLPRVRRDGAQVSRSLTISGRQRLLLANIVSYVADMSALRRGPEVANRIGAHRGDFVTARRQIAAETRTPLDERQDLGVTPPDANGRALA